MGFQPWTDFYTRDILDKYLSFRATYSSAPVSTGNTFQEFPRLCETADDIERYINMIFV
jgi:hypothetical protein